MWSEMLDMKHGWQADRHNLPYICVHFMQRTHNNSNKTGTVYLTKLKKKEWYVNTYR
jgi:hypothetical protein